MEKSLNIGFENGIAEKDGGAVFYCRRAEEEAIACRKFAAIIRNVNIIAMKGAQHRSCTM